MLIINYLQNILKISEIFFANVLDINLKGVYFTASNQQENNLKFTTMTTAIVNVKKGSAYAKYNGQMFEVTSTSLDGKRVTLAIWSDEYQVMRNVDFGHKEVFVIVKNK